ncbi:HAD family hydrolase [Mycetocola miduiensis]|uniref:Haloacid dehalogenase superfamily, subfamily IA, variant 3 with third motif having DD or ED/haloacid dehalogenase superfamily, subfamily IA, variant 1 with third motif having Dx(3-4)D or Dx(3-4)E n=1 Tax=Mycetocola miduiensis TaxID=995034 RepID=A0A1I4YHN7_9MICO|nr:HAD family hydrolase [Mycetocola miduiensis]SFN37526.1 haloacid dehalogenase superfamily, subfamily IA, variant 3 with third motif having DD or ED/haloacid dehalogenase superfamily, subfamily IA, variant 1 with third motif having Dx(3-4)D or Dx(3-4)E [Mycetocola miduiensis]
MTETPKAVLFDVDGTLVDSNYLHVEAWSHAFYELRVPVQAWRIHRAIGQDSAKLLGALLGDRADELGDRAKALHSHFYTPLAYRLRPLDGARELLQALAERGTTVVLATSAPEDELALLTAALDADNSIDATTNADDVDVAKPDPSIVQVALSRADVRAEDAIFVGDSVWDCIAASRAGVRTIGLLCGGSSSAELRSAGAIAVYDDPAALLREIHLSPLA